MSVPSLDRRQRRRLETIEEVLDIAVDIMGEHGVAGLSIGEIARRMGIRPPSLYVYFPSKNALYDALFARGAQAILDEMRRLRASFADASLEDQLLTSSSAFIRWSLDNAAYTQLLFWRPVPGYTPSPEAYAPAIGLSELTTEWFSDLQHRGLLRGDAAIADMHRDWTIVTSGVISQQLSNAPDEDFDNGRFTTALPSIVAMFVARYGTPSTPARSRRRRNADHR